MEKKDKIIDILYGEKHRIVSDNLAYIISYFRSKKSKNTADNFDDLNFDNES